MAAQDSIKVATIFGRTASGSATGVPDLDQEEIRFATTALLGPGYLPSMIDQTANTSSFNVRQDTGSNMQVKVGSGTSKKDGYVLLGTVAGQGAYIVRLDATTKTVTVPAADATNPAKYSVFLYIDDTAYSGTASRAYAQVSCVRGTPAGSPVEPAVPATYSAYVRLWTFQLAANATATTNTILDAGTDYRTPSSLAPQIKTTYGAQGLVVATAGGTGGRGYVTRTTNISSAAMPSNQLLAMSVTWTSVLNRLYKVSGYVPQITTLTGSPIVWELLIMDGTPTQTGGTHGATSADSHAIFEVVVGTGASMTRQLAMTAQSGTIQMQASVSFPAWLTVEDIGPA